MRGLWRRFNIHIFFSAHFHPEVNISICNLNYSSHTLIFYCTVPPSSPYHGAYVRFLSLVRLTAVHLATMHMSPLIQCERIYCIFYNRYPLVALILLHTMAVGTGSSSVCLCCHSYFRSRVQHLILLDSYSEKRRLLTACRCRPFLKKSVPYCMYEI